MASACAHLLIAERTLLSSKKISAATKNENGLFLLGAQGVDFAFFCSKRGGENIGRAIHRGGIYSDFSSLSNYSKKNAEALPWCLGMCSHYATDVVFHGYIYSVLKRDGGGRLKHAAMERAMDRAFSLSRGKKLSYSFLSPEKKQANIIASALNAMRLGAGFSAEEVGRGFKRYRLYLNKISPLFVYRPSEKEKGEWANLFNRSVELSIKTGEEFLLSLEGGELSGNLFALNYLGKKI